MVQTSEKMVTYLGMYEAKFSVSKPLIENNDIGWAITTIVQYGQSINAFDEWNTF